MIRGRPRRLKMKKSIKRRRGPATKGMRNPKQVMAIRARNRVRRRRGR